MSAEADLLPVDVESLVDPETLLTGKDSDPSSLMGGSDAAPAPKPTNNPAPKAERDSPDGDSDATAKSAEEQMESLGKMVADIQDFTNNLVFGGAKKVASFATGGMSDEAESTMTDMTDSDPSPTAQSSMGNYDTASKGNNGDVGQLATKAVEFVAENPELLAL